MVAVAVVVVSCVLAVGVIGAAVASVIATLKISKNDDEGARKNKHFGAGNPSVYTYYPIVY